MKLKIIDRPSSTSDALTVVSSKEAFDRKMGALRAATGRPERLLGLCACALHDRLFTVVYERSDPTTLFTISGIHKDGEAIGAGQGFAASLRRKTSTAIDDTGWRCPYCHIEGIRIACDRCDTTVCGARTRNYGTKAAAFECRPSCGRRSGLAESEFHRVVEPPSHPGPLKRPVIDRQRLPALDTLRLGAPSRRWLK